MQMLRWSFTRLQLANQNRACAIGLRGGHHDLHFDTKRPDAFSTLSPSDPRLYVRTHRIEASCSLELELAERFGSDHFF
jgi:hypothetical protein